MPLCNMLQIIVNGNTNDDTMACLFKNFTAFSVNLSFSYFIN